jgi:hypothetical protein
MTTERKDLYKSRLIDDNKELDYLESNIPVMGIQKYTLYTVPQFTEGRLDLISFIHYKTVRLWWLIAQYNDLTDTTSDEVYVGRILKIPSVSEYYKFYNKNSKIDEITNTFDERTL